MRRAPVLSVLLLSGLLAAAPVLGGARALSAGGKPLKATAPAHARPGDKKTPARPARSPSWTASESKVERPRLSAHPALCVERSRSPLSDPPDPLFTAPETAGRAPSRADLRAGLLAMPPPAA